MEERILATISVRNRLQHFFGKSITHEVVAQDQKDGLNFLRVRFIGSSGQTNTPSKSEMNLHLYRIASKIRELHPTMEIKLEGTPETKTLDIEAWIGHSNPVTLDEIRETRTS